VRKETGAATQWTHAVEKPAQADEQWTQAATKETNGVEKWTRAAASAKRETVQHYGSYVELNQNVPQPTIPAASQVSDIDYH